MENSIEYLDKILKAIHKHNEIRVRKLFSEIETDEADERKGWELIHNPDSQFFNATHY